MAKNAFPLKTGGGTVPKLIGWLVVGGLLVLIVKDPIDAASWAHGLAGLIGTAIDSMATFLRASVNG